MQITKAKSKPDFNKIHKSVDKAKKALPKLDIAALNETVKYSFKYFQSDHPRFYPDTGVYDNNGILELIQRLKGISMMNMNDFMNKYSKSLRNHLIRWEDTAISDGYVHLPFAIELPFQFEISLSHGRVHGFIIDTTFYVVWLDQEHQLYPDK